MLTGLNKIKILHLHEMESTNCKLSCKGCYLTEDNLEKGNFTKENLFQLIDDKTLLTKALYLNNLNRDINSMLKETDLVLEIQEATSNIFTENVLVTDSLSAIKLDGKLLKSYDFTDVLISPRTEQSMIYSMHKLQSEYGKCSILFTAGVDNPHILTRAITGGINAVELNIKKPYSTSDFMNYQEINTYLMQILPNRNIEYRLNTCLDFVTSNKNCSNPDNGEWEITSILGQNDMYTCAYTSNKCIAKFTEEPNGT